MKILKIKKEFVPKSVPHVKVPPGDYEIEEMPNTGVKIHIQDDVSKTKIPVFVFNKEIILNGKIFVKIG